MSVQTAQKIYKEVKALREETRKLKELVFLVLRDSEGEYKDSFAKEIFKKAHSKPRFVYTDKKNFLRQISP